MKALVAAAAALVTLFCGSPALAAEGPVVGSPAESAHSSMVRTKAASRVAKAHGARAQRVRIVRVSDPRPTVGRRVVVTGRTGVSSRTVTLQVRRQTATGHRWVSVDRTRSRRGRFTLTTRVRHDDVDRVRVVAPRTRTVPRAVTKARRILVRIRAAHPRPPAASPTPAAPAPVDDAAHEARAVEAELARLVRAYRGENARTEVGSDACLADWARGFAGTMARTHVFAHSGSSEWEGTVTSAVQACPHGTPATYRQEAIARVTGTTAAEVAASALADLQAAWMHDEVLLDDAGTGRVMEVGAAQDEAGEWFLVVVLGAA